MIINELFYSIQGEGKFSGVPSFFIRLAGCPLRCRWCDTKYAWEKTAGKEMSIKEIKNVMQEYPTRHVVITGGEPMIDAEIKKLVNAFEKEDIHVTLETCGIRYISDLACDLMSISPKLTNSTPQEMLLYPAYDKVRFNKESLQQLINDYDYQLKFVVDRPQDLNEIAHCLEFLDNVDPDKVYLMPQAVNRQEYIEKAKMLAPYCKQTGFAMSPRLQIMIWDEKKGV